MYEGVEYTITEIGDEAFYINNSYGWYFKNCNLTISGTRPEKLFYATMRFKKNTQTLISNIK